MSNTLCLRKALKNLGWGVVGDEWCWINLAKIRGGSQENYTHGGLFTVEMSADIIVAIDMYVITLSAQTNHTQFAP